MYKKLLNSNWTMRRTDSDESIPAQVPGSVYEDLLRNGKMDDPFWKDNEIEALRLMDYDYEYETVFDAEEEFLRSDETIIRFEGLDTLADVYLNDKHIITANNMHRIWESNVGELLKVRDNKLQVLRDNTRCGGKGGLSFRIRPVVYKLRDKGHGLQHRQ